MQRSTTVISLAMWLLLTLFVCAALFACGDSGTSGDSTLPDNSPVEPPADPPDDPPVDPPTGNRFYIDPQKGDMANDGSSEHPWRTLEEVVNAGLIETMSDESGDPSKIVNAGAPVTSGDTLVLLNGHHGALAIDKAYNENMITIRAADGHTPTLTHAVFTAASNWRIQGVTLSPSTASPYEKRTLFEARSGSHHITLEDCLLYSVEDSGAWDRDEWNERACNAISLRGDHMTARGNTCRNVNFGITVMGNFGVVADNIIENFAGDGMRGLGDDLLFEDNVVKNCYDVNDNHDDGFQSWSINDDPPRQRVTLRGNVILNFDGPDYPLRGTLQGIGCFDGPYIDWVVENNLVVTDHWHGISLYGAINSRIVNNTVVDAAAGKPGPPWVNFNDHKNGSPSQGCLVRNNIAASVKTSGDTIADHNYLLESGDTIFVDPDNGDFHLRVDATAVIDTGSADQAPQTDMDGVARPQGAGVDPGCYEQQ